MNYREFGRTGWKVSEISFGAWAIGSAWGTVNDKDSMAALHKALDTGINLFDTADVYGDGHSEKLLAQLKRERKEPFYIITKAGRRLEPHIASGYNKKNLTSFVERSLKNIETETIDLLQLHCPPTEVYYMPEVFDILKGFVNEGKIKFYGVSVEKVEDALKAIEFPDVQSVQIIYNIFRQRPAELFFIEAQKRKVGILARLPLSSGMLTGKFKADTEFENSDHRNFNRDGASFDKGETFSGLDYNKGLAAVEKLRQFVPKGYTLAQFALKWILMNPSISCTIPGAKTSNQVEENCRASDMPAISDSIMDKIKNLYDEEIKRYVHHYW